MSGKFTVLFIAFILLLMNSGAVLSQTDTMSADRKVKAQVSKLGAGAKVTVLLKDGTKVRGSISQIMDDSFDLTLDKQTQSSILSYRDVESVKRRGWSNTAKLALGFGIGVAVVVAVVAGMVANADIGDAFP
jgi:hypothetical protein